MRRQKHTNFGNCLEWECLVLGNGGGGRFVGAKKNGVLLILEFMIRPESTFSAARASDPFRGQRASTRPRRMWIAVSRCRSAAATARPAPSPPAKSFPSSAPLSRPCRSLQAWGSASQLAIIVRTFPEQGGVAPENVGKVDVWYNEEIRTAHRIGGDQCGGGPRR